MRLTALLLTAIFLFAGCTENPADAQDNADPCIVQAADDYSCDLQDEVTGTQTEHLHDYWNGAERIIVMDTPHTDLGPGFASGESIVVHEYRGDTNAIVLQGTQFVDIVLTWTDDDMDMYTKPTLWVQTASQSEPQMVAAIASGDVTRMEITANDWDLPHQRLSAWVYQLRMDGEQPAGNLRFKGETNILVAAERGLEIPLFPAHLDFWDGGNITEISLFSAEHTVQYLHDPGDSGCDGISCQIAHTPDDGVLVPPGTDYVEVTLTTEGSPTTLGLQYHGADTREFFRPTATSSDGNTQVFKLKIDGDMDGPYALQSLWEFMVYITAPIEDGFVSESYTMAAVAYNIDA